MARLTTILLATMSLGAAVAADDPPAWAYPSNPPDCKPAPDDGTIRRVPGSTAGYTLSQVRDLFLAPDWHPDSHAPMPPVVAKGRALVAGEDAGRTPACTACHGKDLRGVDAIPSIAGRSPTYVFRQLFEFHTGSRTGAAGAPMKEVVAKLGQDEMIAIAAYLGTLPPWFQASLHLGRNRRMLCRLPEERQHPSRGESLMKIRFLAALAILSAALTATAAPVKEDYFIDAVDPGIKLFVRSKMAEGQKSFTDDNIVLFVHGATYPSTPDFDLNYKDYSWADWMIDKGYVVYMFDKRNYGFSTREKAMDEPAASNKPVSRSYLVIRDIGAVVDHIRKKHKVNKVTLIGWSWGAMTSGYYTSLHSDNVRKLVMYAPAYSFPLHTNLGPGSGLQNRRKPWEFNYAMGAYRLGSKAGNDGRWDGEIPVADKSLYREEGVRDAFALEALKTDPTSGTRNPPALRAPNGVMEDTFMQATGRPIWNASSIYVPTLVIAGEYDTWSYPEDREGLMRDLTNAPVKKHVLIKDATHFVLFEKPRFEFFGAIHSFLKENP